jgi:hypothetical protein
MKCRDSFHCSPNWALVRRAKSTAASSRSDVVNGHGHSIPAGPCTSCCAPHGPRVRGPCAVPSENRRSVKPCVASHAGSPCAFTTTPTLPTTSTSWCALDAAWLFRTSSALSPASSRVSPPAPARGVRSAGFGIGSRSRAFSHGVEISLAFAHTFSRTISKRPDRYLTKLGFAEGNQEPKALRPNDTRARYRCESGHRRALEPRGRPPFGLRPTPPGRPKSNRDLDFLAVNNAILIPEPDIGRDFNHRLWVVTPAALVGIGSEDERAAAEDGARS